MYRYEIHCHTSETSACSHISAADLIDFYKKAGYDAVIITDHFLNGNTTVPQFLPWKKKIELFAKGYKNAKKRGDEIGVDVYFGWEVSTGGTDFLTYGLDENWLLEHKDCDKMRISDYCDLVRQSGGYIVQAHPFREADYIELIRLLPRKVDGVEVINACRTDFENRMAEQYADNYGLKKFAGTDNHHGLREKLAAMETDFKVSDSKELIKAALDGQCRNVLYKVTEDKGIIELTEI